jgi:hypothetical protein
MISKAKCYKTLDGDFLCDISAHPLIVPFTLTKKGRSLLANNLKIIIFFAYYRRWNVNDRLK